MGQVQINSVYNTDLAMRNIFVSPPEPPADFLLYDPTNAIYIGKTKLLAMPFYWTYMRTTNPHIAVVGISGSGKSYFIKTFLLRASYIWGANAFIIDWAGEYKEWVKQSGGKVLSMGKGAYLNLLDLGGMRPYDRIKQVVRSLEILTDIGKYPEQRRLTEQALEKCYLAAGFKMDSFKQVDSLGKELTPPTLKDVQRHLDELLESGTYEFPAELENAIYRIKQFTKEGQDYFAQQSTIKLDEVLNSGLVDFDVSGLPDEVFRGLAALSMLQFIKEKMRMEGWTHTKGIKLFVVLDEAWKIAKDDNSDAVMIVREGRKYQFSLIVGSQNPTDISENIFSNVGTTFIFRVKFERYLNFLQNTLNFSDYIRHDVSSFGVGECAVNMAFQTSLRFSETFLLDKVDGEEPLIEYFLKLDSVFEEMGSDDMAKVVSFEKEELRRRLRMYGLSDSHIEEISTQFDKKNRHLDVVNFVILLEKYGLPRSNITSFLKDMGIEDSTLINIFSKADFKRLDIGDRDISQVIMEEE